MSFKASVQHHSDVRVLKQRTLGQDYVVRLHEPRGDLRINGQTLQKDTVQTKVCTSTTRVVSQETWKSTAIIRQFPCVVQDGPSPQPRGSVAVIEHESDPACKESLQR